MIKRLICVRILSHIVLLILLLVGITELQAQYLNSLKVYVWDFAVRNNRKSPLTTDENEKLATDLTNEFEEAISKSGSCEVLERRNFDKVVWHWKNEMTVADIPESVRQTLLINHVNVFITGEVYDDVDDGKIKVTVTFTDFNSQILRESIDFTRGKRLDSDERKKAMQILMNTSIKLFDQKYIIVRPDDLGSGVSPDSSVVRLRSSQDKLIEMNNEKHFPDNTEREINAIFVRFCIKLNNFKSEDPKDLAFKNKVQEALNAVDLETLESLLNEAIQEYKNKIKEQEKNLDKSRLSLANIYSFSGQNEAIQEYKNKIKEQEKNLDKSRLSLANICSFSGQNKKIRLRYKDAADNFDEAIKYFKTIESFSGEKDLILADYENEMGWCLYKAGLYDQAEPQLKDSVKIRELFYEKEPIREHESLLADSIYNIAMVYCRQGQLSKSENSDKYKYDESKKLYKRALKMRENVFGKDHWSVAETLNGLGALYYIQRSYVFAAESFSQSLQILRLGSTEEENLKLADCLNNIGVFYFVQSKYDKAETFFLEAFNIRNNNLPENHPAMAEIYSNLGSLYSKRENYTEAEIYYKKALDIWKNILGERHPTVAETLHNLEVINAQQNNYTKSPFELYMHVNPSFGGYTSKVNANPTLRPGKPGQPIHVELNVE